MGIATEKDYVKFFLDLQMGKEVTLYNFLNNEKMIMKGKLDNKNTNKERLKTGMVILDKLISEINEIGEKEVIEKYGR
ncbi:hypothetical protein NsoK4_03605 [Nitrosopumilus sp. K4]|uniref:hypothetical protein n=1 Tax=Nitrosopumilus sp. K4 TaxID=2795383 RepID=UPI001BACEEF4|nr:hypothetical protein [Nitrosopumilus sp. K4]QUC65341.1 hypothetical protein NsoK4_03605 [Nitrosopumilus sp. K4]